MQHTCWRHTASVLGMLHDSDLPLLHHPNPTLATPTRLPKTKTHLTHPPTHTTSTTTQHTQTLTGFILVLWVKKP